MGLVISYLRSIFFRTKNEVCTTSDEENGYKAPPASCDEVKPIQPTSRVSEEDGVVVIVVPDAESREAIEPSPPASINQNTNPASEDETVTLIDDEENRYKAPASCDEVKLFQPNSRISEEDGVVVIVVPNTEFREAVEPTFSASINPNTSPVSEDEWVTPAVDGDVESVEEIKSIVHVSVGDKIRVPKDAFPIEKKIKHYKSSQKILLVGEGDFSFSACLAKAFGSAVNMVATSLNSRDFLKKHYSNAISNINGLKSRGCVVLHGVDATNMSGNNFLKGMRFDRIVFNFPYAGLFKEESREVQLSRHQKLVTLFFKNAKKMLSEDGEIHVSHKSNGFHIEWNIENLANVCGLNFIKAVTFNLNDFPGYHTKYGFGGDRNFDCNPSNTYMFGM